MATTTKNISDHINAGHIFLLYHGEEIFIDPRTNMDTGKMQFWLAYKKFVGIYDSEDELFNAKAIGGHSLIELCPELDID